MKKSPSDASEAKAAEPAGGGRIPPGQWLGASGRTDHHHRGSGLGGHSRCRRRSRDAVRGKIEPDGGGDGRPQHEGVSRHWTRSRRSWKKSGTSKTRPPPPKSQPPKSEPAKSEAPKPQPQRPGRPQRQSPAPHCHSRPRRHGGSSAGPAPAPTEAATANAAGSAPASAVASGGEGSRGQAGRLCWTVCGPRPSRPSRATNLSPWGRWPWGRPVRWALKCSTASRRPRTRRNSSCGKATIKGGRRTGSLLSRVREPRRTRPRPLMWRGSGSTRRN